MLVSILEDTPEITIAEETTETSDTEPLDSTDVSAYELISETVETSETETSELEPTDTAETTVSETVETTTEVTTSATTAQTESTTVPTTVAATPTPAPTLAPTPTPKPSYTETSLSKQVYASCQLNVRSGPGTDYETVKTIDKGSAIDVIRVTDNGWYHTYNGNWVVKDLCQDNPPVVATPTPVPQQTVSQTQQTTQQTTAAPTTAAASNNGMTYYGSCTITFYVL